MFSKDLKQKANLYILCRITHRALFFSVQTVILILSIVISNETLNTQIRQAAGTLIKRVTILNEKNGCMFYKLFAQVIR